MKTSILVVKVPAGCDTWAPGCDTWAQWAASLKGLPASPDSIPNSSSDPDGAVLPALPPLPGPRCLLGLWGPQWSTVVCFFSASFITDTFLPY